MELLTKIGKAALRVLAYVVSVLVAWILGATVMGAASLFLQDSYTSTETMAHIEAFVIVLAAAATVLAAILNFLTSRAWLSWLILSGLGALADAACVIASSSGQHWRIDVMAFGIVWVALVVMVATICFSQAFGWRKLRAVCP